MLTLNLVTATTPISVHLTGSQAWTLAGVLIDATVAYTHAAAGWVDTIPSIPSLPPSTRPDSSTRPF